MTDNEIIKALENIMNEKIGCCKEDCNFYDGKVHGCAQTIAKHSLNLINRQKAEIKKCENIIRLADKTIEKQSAEIKRLRQLVSDTGMEVLIERTAKVRLKEELESAKTETVKEYERLLSNELSCLLDCTYGSKWSLYKVADVRDAIKKVSAEMVGADNGNTEKDN